MDPIDEPPSPPPFWLQTATAHHHLNHHQQHRRASSLLLNTGVLVMLLVVTAVVFLVIVIPSVERHVFNPTLVKTGWSSLNVVLVVFAIVCGFLNRKDDDQSPVNTPTEKDEFDDNVQILTQLRRCSSSYPDLRQESNLMSHDDAWRFYDDCQISTRPRSFRKTHEEDRDQVGAKDIEVDTFVRKTDDISSEDDIPPPSPMTSKPYFWPSQPPAPPPPPPRRRHSSIPAKKKINDQTFETIGYEMYKWKTDNDSIAKVRKPKTKARVLPPPPPLPPPPLRLPPVVVAHYRENKKQESSDKKRGGVNVITKEFFSSLYHQSKNKGKHKIKSYDNLENLIEPSKTSSIHRSKSTPEFIHTIFPKKCKTRPKPKFKPPPPPRRSQVKSSSYSGYCTSEDESSTSPTLLFSGSPDVNVKADDFIAKFRANLNLEQGSRRHRLRDLRTGSI